MRKKILITLLLFCLIPLYSQIQLYTITIPFGDEIEQLTYFNEAGANCPSAFGVDLKGNFYIDSSYWDHKIKIFDKNGTYIKCFKNEYINEIIDIYPIDINTIFFSSYAETGNLVIIRDNEIIFKEVASGLNQSKLLTKYLIKNNILYYQLDNSYYQLDFLTLEKKSIKEDEVIKIEFPFESGKFSKLIGIDKDDNRYWLTYVKNFDTTSNKYIGRYYIKVIYNNKIVFEKQQIKSTLLTIDQLGNIYTLEAKPDIGAEINKIERTW